MSWDTGSRTHNSIPLDFSTPPFGSGQEGRKKEDTRKDASVFLRVGEERRRGALDRCILGCCLRDRDHLMAFYLAIREDGQVSRAFKI